MCQSVSPWQFSFLLLGVEYCDFVFVIRRKVVNFAKLDRVCVSYYENYT